MDVIVMILIEKHVGIPFDIVLYLNEFIKYEKLTNETIVKAVKLWCDNKQLCLFRYGHISYWDVSKVTIMYSLFIGNKTFNDDISRWNVSNVTNMHGMFYCAESFNSDISNWNVSKVIYTMNMFYGATSFKGDISRWDCSKELIYGWTYDCVVKTFMK